MSARPIRRSVPAVAGAVAVFVLLPALLVALARHRYGTWTPLDGMDAPWRWTVDGARSWGSRLTGDLHTSRELIDVRRFVEPAAVTAEIGLPHVVDEDEDDVGVFRGRAEPGRRGR